MTKFCVIDTETIPSQSLKHLFPKFDPQTIKLGNLKDPAKIKEKVDCAQMEFMDSLDKKMSLDPDLCEVVCFVGIRHIPPKKPLDTILYDVKEITCVFEAWSFIKEAYLDHIPLVSFNGIGFDLPVLWHQAMRLGIPVSAQMYYDLTKRYDNKWHYDLMEILSTWDFAKKKTKPLAFYLELFGLGDKLGDGSQIYGWWRVGQYDKIREHCEADCRLTAKLFEKLQGYIVKED